MIRAVRVTLIAAFCACAAVATALEPQPQPLAPIVVAAWQKAGAQPGWMALKNSYYWAFRPGVDGKAGDVAAFCFPEREPGALGKLPAPRQPFGLDLNDTQVTDADLTDLAACKELRLLNLGGAKITGSGLKELAALKQLQALYLSYSKITDAGLKELAAFPQLQILNLRGTKVTDAGLKELAALQQLQSLNLHAVKMTDAGFDSAPFLL